jgi:hypothetical protein
MEITGTVEQVLPLESGVSKAGKDWKKQTFVIGLESESNYPKSLAIVCFGKALEYMPSVGQTVKCQVDVTSRESNGRWYTEASAWRIESEKVREEQPNIVQPEGDLPF